MKTITFSLILSILFLISCVTEDIEVLKERAEIALTSNNNDQAIGILKKALEVHPNDDELNYFMGQAYKQKIYANGNQLNNVDADLVIKASYHFKKVIELSPNYNGKMFVVGPYTKIQSIWGGLGLTLLSRKQIDAARKTFIEGQKEGGFYPAIMEFNKNIMRSCDSNAILFTNGDNDTFPMWFLQLVEKYRNDITIVNLSLLNLNWYSNQLTNNYPFGINNIDMSDSMTSLKDENPITWQTKVVNISNENNGEKISWDLKPTIDNRALRQQDIRLYEIINSNKFKRPVYFSTTVYRSNKIGLDEYLSLEGLVYKLESHKQTISADKIEENIISYTYEGLEDKHLEYIDEIKSLYQNYKYIFYKMSQFYYDTDNIERARELLIDLENYFPESKIPVTNNDLKNQIENLKNKI